ncbi:hypothetical protein I4U23_007486 [Adineta vaga]|nr:hypothetical protein I4U23_007486 [Adineta vaga]
MFTTATRTIFPMIFGRRHPETLSDAASTPLQLIRLQIEQKVNGDFPLIHQVATTMTFKNTHNIILEGAFEFTLPEKATICGYGLDVDGVIVDGVIVEKQTARIIFESEVRKRVDPGFVELVTGNVFRTRVYPIEPQKTRTIRVIYQDQGIPNNSGFQYHIPVQFQTPLESLDIVITCIQQGTTKPYFLTATNQFNATYPNFNSKGNGNYHFEWHLTNVQPSTGGEQTLIYVLPDSLKPILSAVEKSLNIGAYFAVSCALPTLTERRIDQLDLPTKTICVLWDASLSRSNAIENRLLELNALKKIFDIWLTRLSQIDVIIIIFRNDMEQAKLFQLQFHNWNDFMKIFEDLPYDGATNLSQIATINLTQTVNYYFLFSDSPLWIFNGNHLHEPYDSDFVRYLTQYNSQGGGYLNREKLQLNSNDLLNMIETIQIKYIKLHSTTTIQQIYPSDTISIPSNTDRFLLVGQIPNPLPNAVEFELEFSMNNQTTRLPISVSMPTDVLDFFGLIRRLWAQQKLNQLNAFKDKYKTEIISLGLQYSLVSHFTSLLVLETLQQHLQYRVCPATTRINLHRQYMQHQTKENNLKTNNQSEILRKWNEKCQWYDKVITDIDRHRAYLPKTTPVSSIYGNTYTSYGSPSSSPFGFSTASPAYASQPFASPTSNTSTPASVFSFGSSTVSSTAPTLENSRIHQPLAMPRVATVYHPNLQQ